MDESVLEAFRRAGWRVEVKTAKQSKENRVQHAIERAEARMDDSKVEQLKTKQAAETCFMCKAPLPSGRNGCQALQLGGWVCWRRECRDKAESFGFIRFNLRRPKPRVVPQRKAPEPPKQPAVPSRLAADMRLIEIGKKLQAKRMVRFLVEDQDGNWSCELFNEAGKCVAIVSGDSEEPTDFSWLDAAAAKTWRRFVKSTAKPSGEVFMALLFGFKLADRRVR